MFDLARLIFRGRKTRHLLDQIIDHGGEQDLAFGTRRQCRIAVAAGTAVIGRGRV